MSCTILQAKYMYVKRDEDIIQKSYCTRWNNHRTFSCHFVFQGKPVFCLCSQQATATSIIFHSYFVGSLICFLKQLCFPNIVLSVQESMWLRGCGTNQSNSIPPHRDPLPHSHHCPILGGNGRSHPHRAYPQCSLGRLGPPSFPAQCFLSSNGPRAIPEERGLNPPLPTEYKQRTMGEYALLTLQQSVLCMGAFTNDLSVCALFPHYGGANLWGDPFRNYRGNLCHNCSLPVNCHSSQVIETLLASHRPSTSWTGKTIWTKFY